MKKLILAIYLLFTTIIANPFNSHFKIEPKREIKEEDKDTKIIIDKTKYNTLFEVFINVIKLHEGFRSKPYHTGIDTDGWTIGYGHLIKKGEHFTSITEEEATSLLKQDFNKAIVSSRKYNRSSLQEHQILALAHFIYAKGIGNYLKSKLKRRVDSARNIDRQIKRWSTIVIDGKRIKHKWMLRNREFELAIYNGADPIKELIKYKDYVRDNYGITDQNK